MRRGLSRFIWLAVALLCFSSAIFLAKRGSLKTIRLEAGLSFENSPAPSPELSFAFSMGVFRSVVIDILWLKASALQSEGKYFELVQLYDMIGKLQPYNSAVWNYTSWNMAYNISVEFSTDEERWRWIQHGLDRLRKHGIRYNPKDLMLYQELSRIFTHKIGQNTDNSHLYYKTKLFEDISATFSPFAVNATEVAKALSELDPEKKKQAMVIQARLKDKLNMDLLVMAELEQDPRFGPLDWRLAEVHGIYWADQGLRHGEYGVLRERLQGSVYQAMQSLLRMGTAVHMPATGGQSSTVVIWPDYRQVWPIHRMFLKQIEIFSKSKIPVSRVYDGYGYFIEEAIDILFQSGQEAQAEKLFIEARKVLPNKFNTSHAEEYFKANFVLRMKNSTGDEFSSLVSSMLMKSYWWLGQGDEKKSSSMLKYAQVYWGMNVKKNNRANRSVNRDFQTIKKAVLSSIIKNKLFHPEILEGIEKNLPPELLKSLQNKND